MFSFSVIPLNNELYIFGKERFNVKVQVVISFIVGGSATNVSSAENQRPPLTESMAILKFRVANQDWVDTGKVTKIARNQYGFSTVPFSRISENLQCTFG